MKRLCREAGVPELSCHGGRHSTSELWQAHGATEEDIGRILMQKSRTTTRKYMHGELTMTAYGKSQSRSVAALHQNTQFTAGTVNDDLPSNVIPFKVVNPA